MGPEIRVATLPGTVGGVNEDAYLVSDRLVVVADGATSPAELGTGCGHGPAWYAHTLVANVAAAHHEAAGTLPQVLADAIAATTSAHADTCDVNHAGSPSATIAILEMGDGDEARWLVLGDCTLLLEHGDGRVDVVCDERLSATSHSERAALLTAGVRLDAADHATRIAALITAQRAHRNRDGGFWVAANDPIAAHHAVTGTAPIGGEGLRRAAVLTDGVTRAVDTYRQHTWAELLDDLDRHGPRAVLDRIRDVEQRKPGSTSRSDG